MNAQQRLLAALCIDGESICAHRDDWGRIVKQVAPALPLGKRPLDHSMVTDWQLKARLVTAFLVPDVSWLPFTWAKHGNEDSTCTEQYAKLLIPHGEPEAPDGWFLFLVQLVTILNEATAYDTRLREACDDDEDRYLRTSADLYREISATLLALVSLEGQEAQRLADSYILEVDGGRTLWPLLERDVPDRYIVAIHERLFKTLFWDDRDTRTYCGHRAAQLDQDRLREMYGGPMSWLSQWIGHRFYAMLSTDRPPLPRHAEFSRHLFQRPDMLRGAYVDLSAVYAAMKRYPEPEMDDPLHALARTVIVDELCGDWTCPSKRYARHDYDLRELRTEMRAIRDRWPADGGLARTLNHWIQWLDRELQKRKEARERIVVPPEPVRIDMS